MIFKQSFTALLFILATYVTVITVNKPDIITLIAMFICWFIFLILTTQK